MLAEGLSLPVFAQYSGLGPGFMPVFLGVALLATASALCVQVWKGERFEPEAAEGVDLETPLSIAGLGMAVAAVILPIAAIPWLGFPVGAGLGYACVTRAYGSPRLWRDALVGLALSSLTWLAFTRLGVQLGPFFPLLKA